MWKVLLRISSKESVNVKNKEDELEGLIEEAVEQALQDFYSVEFKVKAKMTR